MHDELKCIEVGGWYTVQFPSTAKYEYVEEDKTLQIFLGDPEPIFIARYAFNADTHDDRQIAIDQMLRTFAIEIIGNKLGYNVCDYDYFSLSEGMTIGNQGAVPIAIDRANPASSRLWLIRFIVSNPKNHYYLMHWNGPFRTLRQSVFPVLDSFRSLE